MLPVKMKKSEKPTISLLYPPCIGTALYAAKPKSKDDFGRENIAIITNGTENVSRTKTALTAHQAAFTQVQANLPPPNNKAGGGSCNAYAAFFAGTTPIDASHSSRKAMTSI